MYSELTASILDSLYTRYHHVEFVHPDPLEIVLKFQNPGDQEVAAIIASSFATGRVNSILKAVEEILSPFPSLKSNLLSAEKGDLEKLFGNFNYRFYNSSSLVDFLFGIKNTLLEYGTLENCFKAGLDSYALSKGIPKVNGGLISLFRSIGKYGGASRKVLPDPEKGSACKRLNMFLRWMIRDDEIDPGIWTSFSRAELVIPLDTHIMQLSHILGFTKRKQADIKTALEITNALKVYDNEDPVRFDFSLSRLGIHPDLTYDELLRVYSRVSSSTRSESLGKHSDTRGDSSKP